jgi:phage/plasmid-associated DNA primase
VEGKFRTPTTYVPFCKLIFAANHRLESNDESVGYARRIMHIPFAQTFALNPAKEKELHTIFNDSGEMSGLFNEITKRLSDTLERGLRIPEEVMEFVDNYDPIPDAAIKWLKANVSESPEGRVPIHPFNVVYNLNATWGMERSDIIYRYLKHLFKGISKGKCRIDGGRVNSYMGIGVSEDVRLWMSRVQEGKVVEEEG